jgi:ATPase subunit of ABC transporter with duplicated ATPase domains
METKNILIQLNNASFKYPLEDYLFTNVKLTVQQGDRTAIVGANGSGKSTLLKLLTGKLQLDEGTQTINGKVYYVPQIDLSVQQKGLKIYEYISQYYEDWWEIIPELSKLFDLDLDTEAETKSLSGGELMKLNLTIAIKQNPDVLILDEPTNHLDIKSIRRLIKFINEDFKDKYTYVIVSHDTFFLDQVVNNIWELENKKITSYGGNYTFFVEQKQLHLRGIKKQYELAKDKLEKAKELKQEEETRFAKKANQAKREYIKGSIDKKALSEGKSAATSGQHGKNLMLERLMEDAEEKLEQYQTEERKLGFMGMQNTADNRGRTVFEIKEGTLKLNNNELIKKLNLKVTYGDRIMLSGSNGSGKTSLVKALLKKTNTHSEKLANEPAEIEGSIYVGETLEWVYLDQRYDLINPELTLIENLMAYNGNITESKAKEQLGKVMFKTDIELNKKARNLSGGQMVRLVMAMITSFPIDLLILDEPTNNLDVETVQILIKSINQFRGAVFVISHNVDFLHSIKIESAFVIKDKKLVQIKTDISNKEAFYNSLSV